MSEEDFKKKINLNRIILPLFHVKIKNNKNFKLSKSLDEIKSTTNEIIKIIKDSNKIKKDEVGYYKNFIMETISIMHAYEISINDNTCIDEIKENILDLFESTSIEGKDLEGEYFDRLIPIKIYSEINKFHSMLYLNGVIDFEKLKFLNKNILISINKINLELIGYLKTKTFSDKKYIYETIKIASVVYTDILEVLFVNLSKNEKKLNDYVEKQKSYIKKIEELFIEQYSLFNSSCNKLRDKIES